MDDSRDGAVTVVVRGLVQGIGFRPCVYRLARHHQLNGWVRNDNEGVTIFLEGTRNRIEAFLLALPREAPPAADIESIHVTRSDEATPAPQFFIADSEDDTSGVTRISPDLAVCSECLADMESQDRRRGYPFTNCTNCGPRFSLVKSVPYDRSRTTMSAFSLCPDCEREYRKILDRRFHAQPVSCWNCGPQYRLLLPDRPSPTCFSEMLETVARILGAGGIVAIKGTGGFHLACDARNAKALQTLRRRKRRETKPFALLFRDLPAVREVAAVDATEGELLESVRRPIVLLRVRADRIPAQGVSVGLDTVGAMLPSTPLHHLLLGKLRTRNITALVFTSGNISAEPIVIDNSEAERVLLPIADAVLLHDLEIYNRLDDSVAIVAADRPRIVRRSRGYVPDPIRLTLSVDGIIATGGEYRTSFAVGRVREAIMSQHVGDLGEDGTFAFYRETLVRFCDIFRVVPEMLACDLHPDYLSTIWAEQQGLPLVRVQHHHAHIASCLAENGVPPDRKAIGLAFDGTGYGSDGAIWGSEVLIADMGGFERFAHFEYIPLPGGDAAVQEPWRGALSYLLMAFGKEKIPLDLPGLKGIPSQAVGAVLQALEMDINCPLTSSAGRLFDAVAALVGLGTRATFDAEGPMRLAAALPEHNVAVAAGIYPFEKGSGPTGSYCLRFGPTIRALVENIRRGVDPSLLSARFHNTILEAALSAVREARHATGLNHVALSGGVFQNRYLLQEMITRLTADRFSVLTHARVPANDGGLALGQLVVAACTGRNAYVSGSSGSGNQASR